MSTTAINVSGTVATPNGGYLTVGIAPIVNAAAIGSESNPVLTTGNTTIAAPDGAVAVIVQPPSGNTIGITLMENDNETGVHLHPTIGTGGPLGLASNITQIVLVADSTMSLPTQVIFL